MRQMLVQTQLQIEATAVTNGFCWAYTNALVQKLKKLKKGDELAEKDSDSKRWYLTEISQVVCRELDSQIKRGRSYNHGFDDEKEAGEYVDELIGVADEFLAIFKKD